MDRGRQGAGRARRAGWIAVAVVVLGSTVANAEPRHAWRPTGAAAAQTLADRIPPPDGFVRVPAAEGSFAAWLRALPMKPEGAPVLTYTGAEKSRQDVHIAVVDIDVGNRDLQQCADAVMRLRAEWLYSLGRTREIAFNNTEGQRLRFSARRDTSYRSFRKYMDFVFAYAGTYSLERELVPVSVAEIQAGDVFIKGGFPGHAVLVTDVAVDAKTGEKRFLLTQSYMPAQEIHVLKNPASADGSPWYDPAFGDVLVTPEWRFPRQALRRWKPGPSS